MFRIKESIKKVSGLVGMCLLLGVMSLQAAPTVINTADAGAGSLRQAIIDAITASAATTIDFNIPTSDPGYDIPTNRFTITLLTPLPNIPLAPLTINNIMGRGVTVKGGSSFRIFTTVNSAVVIINNLTMSNGNSNGVGDLAKGGGIFMGNSTTLTLNNCIVSANTATNGGGGIWINDSGTLHVFDSTISNNTTTGGDGGGIRINNSGTLNITRSTVSGNHADATAPAGRGGGIYNGVSGTVNAFNSTVNGNTAGNLGGGINNSETPATATVSSSTISSNTATNGGGGILNGATSTATLNNSLVALNTGTGSPDLLGAFTASYTLVGNADGSTPSGANNQLGTTISPIDPRIGALRDNGGATFTRALLTQSPAIDKGNTSLPTDQRGRARPYDNPLIPNAPGGNGADIGSFERTFSPTPFDFDGDGKTDVSIFRPSDGTWWWQRSSDLVVNAAQFGSGTDKVVAADYTGDGKTDIAFFRPSTGQWFILRSEDGSYFAFPFGTNGDIPMPADYDGDGKADPAVFRPSSATWFILRSSDGQVTFTQFGANGDLPVASDYDGDGKADVAIFRQNGANGAEWWIQRSTAGLLALQFGSSTDKAVPGDYTGDGKSDIAFFRPSTGFWYVLRSQDFSYYAFPWGQAGDIAAPGDYDGDGKFDAAVFRPSNSTWYVNRSTAGPLFVGFGLATDQPVPNAYVR